MENVQELTKKPRMYKTKVPFVGHEPGTEMLAFNYGTVRMYRLGKSEQHFTAHFVHSEAGSRYFERCY